MQKLVALYMHNNWQAVSQLNEASSLSFFKRQEAPLPRRAQRVHRAYLVYFMTFIGRQTTDQQLINHLYETGHETYRIPRNNAK